MRVLVTGCLNPYGRAVAQALAEAGHTVRAFGVPPGTDPFGHPRIECFPGRVEVSGSLEPVAVECKAIVHCTVFDEVGKDRRAHAVRIERGMLHARYAAERELVDAFVALLPTQPDRAWAKVLENSERHVQATSPLVPHFLLRAGSPDEAAREALGLLERTVEEEPPAP
jgi:hypothetical protein